MSKDIIIGQDKTQLLHAASSFMRQQSSGKYNVFLSKKTNKVEHNNTRQIKSEQILPVLYICL